MSPDVLHRRRTTHLVADGGRKEPDGVGLAVGEEGVQRVIAQDELLALGVEQTWVRSLHAGRWGARSPEGGRPRRVWVLAPLACVLACSAVSLRDGNDDSHVQPRHVQCLPLLRVCTHPPTR